MNNDDIAELNDMDTSKNLQNSSLNDDDDDDDNLMQFEVSDHDKNTQAIVHDPEEGEIVDETDKHNDNKENEASLFRHRTDVNRRQYRSRGENIDEEDDTKVKKHKKHDREKRHRTKSATDHHRSNRSGRLHRKEGIHIANDVIKIALKNHIWISLKNLKDDNL